MTREKSYLRPRSKVANLAMILAIAYFTVPIFWVIVNSTKDNQQLFSTFSLWFPSDSWHFWDNLKGLTTQDGGIYIK
jgi:multiple sugar transport system permease protein